MGKGNENLVYPSLWDFKSSFTCYKILWHGTFQLYFPSERKVCCGFLLPLKIHCLGRFEPTTFGSSGKHTNHYTTEATSVCMHVTIVEWLNRFLKFNFGQFCEKLLSYFSFYLDHQTILMIIYIRVFFDGRLLI
jgi:hypothetical protein